MIRKWFDNLSDRQRKVASGVLIVALLGGAYAYWAAFLRPNPNSADFPEGTFWICRTNGHHFHLTMKQLSDHHKAHYGEPIPCPQCGSTDTIPAIRCEKCGEYFPSVRGEQPPCPKCGWKPPNQ